MHALLYLPFHVRLLTITVASDNTWWLHWTWSCCRACLVPSSCSWQSQWNYQLYTPTTSCTHQLPAIHTNYQLYKATTILHWYKLVVELIVDVSTVVLTCYTKSIREKTCLWLVLLAVAVVWSLRLTIANPQTHIHNIYHWQWLTPSWENYFCSWLSSSQPSYLHDYA